MVSVKQQIIHDSVKHALSSKHVLSSLLLLVSLHCLARYRYTNKHAGFRCGTISLINMTTCTLCSKTAFIRVSMTSLYRLSQPLPLASYPAWVRGYPSLLTNTATSLAGSPPSICCSWQEVSELFPGDAILEVNGERVKYAPVEKVVEAITRVPPDNSEMSVRLVVSLCTLVHCDSGVVCFIEIEPLRIVQSQRYIESAEILWRTRLVHIYVSTCTCV